MKDIIINKIKINNLKPLRKKFKNKNKKFAARGYYKDVKVKVYEVFDKNQGKLRKFVSNNKDLSKYFPKLIAFNNRFIVEEWVEGKTLKELNIYDNTVIILSSDNGPTYTGGVDFEYFQSSKPFSNGFGKTKGYTYEGGIRVPMIVSWPNKIRPGSKSNHISVGYDMMPTICDIANTTSPKNIDGLSFFSELLEKEQKSHEFLYWEFPSYNGQQAVRLGNWKGIRKNIFDGNLDIELYNLNNDLLEKNNVHADHPEIVSKIVKIMDQEHEPSTNERFKFKQLGDK